MLCSEGVLSPLLPQRPSSLHTSTPQNERRRLSRRGSEAGGGGSNHSHIPLVLGAPRRRPGQDATSRSSQPWNGGQGLSSYSPLVILIMPRSRGPLT